MKVLPMENYLIHYYTKSIARGFNTNTKNENSEIEYSELLKVDSKRKKSFLGSSGK